MGGKRLEIGDHGTITTWVRDGVWYARARYRDSAGVVKPYERRGKTEKTAKAALRKAFSEWNDANQASRSLTGSAKLTAVIEMHFDWLAEEVAADRRSPGTVRTYRSVYRHHLEPKITGWRLDDATTQRLDDVLSRIASTAGLESAKTARAVLSAALKLAVRYGAIPTNPMLNARGTPTPRKKEVRTLTAQQSVELVQAMRENQYCRDHDLPDLVLWMLTMSDRIGNALATRWSRVDLEQGYAVLGPIIVHVVGKGLVEREGDVSSKSRQRLAVLPDVVRARLRARKLAAPPRCAYVFPHSGTRGRAHATDDVRGPRDPSNVAKEIKRGLAECGYDWITPHVFRKSVATGLRDAGVPTNLVAQYLGHANERETTGTYIGDGSTHPAIVAALNDRWRDLDEAPAEVVSLDERRKPS